MEHLELGSQVLSCLTLFTPLKPPLSGCSQEWEKGFQEQHVATGTCMCCPWPPIEQRIREQQMQRNIFVMQVSSIVSKGVSSIPWRHRKGA